MYLYIYVYLLFSSILYFQFIDSSQCLGEFFFLCAERNADVSFSVATKDEAWCDEYAGFV